MEAEGRGHALGYRWGARWLRQREAANTRIEVGQIRSRQARLRQERSKSFESGYFKFLIAFLCLVAVIQGLLRFDSMRALLNESVWLEGQPLARALTGFEEPLFTWIEWPLAHDAQAGEVGIICLRFVGEPNNNVWILVNGKAAKRAVTEDGVVMCRDGDLIEIVAEKGRANVVVSAVSSNIASPHVGTWVKGEGVLLLGRVKLTEH